MESLDYRKCFLAGIVRFSHLLCESYVEKYSKKADAVNADICSFWKKLIFWCPIFYFILLLPIFIIYAMISVVQLVVGFVPPRFTHIGLSIGSIHDNSLKREMKRNFGIKRAVYPYQIVLIFLLLWWWKSSPKTMATFSNEIFAPFFVNILPWAVLVIIVIVCLVFAIAYFFGESKSWELFKEGYKSFKNKYCKKLVY